DQLRTDRDRFAEAYRVVRDTVSDANEMLTRFGAGRPFPPVNAEAGPPISLPSESNAADEEPAPVFAPEQRPRIRPSREPRPTRAEREGPPKPRRRLATGIGLGELPGRPEPAPPTVRQPEREPEPEPEGEPETAREPDEEVTTEVASPPHNEPAPTSEPAAPHEPEPAAPVDAETEQKPESDAGDDVDALFERMRGTREEKVEEPRIDFGAHGGLGDGDGRRGGGGEEPMPNVPEGQVLVETAPVRASADVDPELLARRDELLAPIAHE